MGHINLLSLGSLKNLNEINHSDFADKFQSAQVVGTDLSDIQPYFVPPNCKFQLGDAQLEWAFRPGQFDFVHIRRLFGSIQDWPALYSEISKCTKPGRIEQLEMSIEFKSDDDSLADPNPIMRRWSKLFNDNGDEQGRTFKIADRSKNYIKEAVRIFCCRDTKVPKLMVVGVC